MLLPVGSGELGLVFRPDSGRSGYPGVNTRALSGGVVTDDIFEMVRKVRKTVEVPMVFMTYANLVFSYGTARFLRIASEIGIDGLILPDVPFEEREEFAPVCNMYGLDLISFVAPTSNERISMIAKNAQGFVYCVSSLGVTGVRKKITTDVGSMVKLIRKSTDIPVAIGFGISTPEQAAELAGIADVIVGSAIVKLIEQYGRDAACYVAEYTRTMKSAISKLN